MSINTANNTFYETLLLKNKDQAKAIIVPAESEKFDLGKRSKKFENIFYNNLPSSSSRNVTYGTWTFQFDFRFSLDYDGRNNTLPTSDQTPITTVNEARYQKTKNIVACFARFSVRKPKKQPGYLFANIKNIPFPFYSKIPYFLRFIGGGGNEAKFRGHYFFLNSQTISGGFRAHSSPPYFLIKRFILNQTPFTLQSFAAKFFYTTNDD